MRSFSHITSVLLLGVIWLLARPSYALALAGKAGPTASTDLAVIFLASLGGALLGRWIRGSDGALLGSALIGTIAGSGFWLFFEGLFIGLAVGVTVALFRPAETKERNKDYLPALVFWLSPLVAAGWAVQSYFQIPRGFREVQLPHQIGMMIGLVLLGFFVGGLLWLGLTIARSR